MRRKRFLKPAAVLLVATGVLACSAAWAAERPRPVRRGPRPGAVTLKPGQPAPDIALHPLTFKTNDKGDQVGTIGQEKVKLSAYKHKAPIVIFSSSYT